MGLREIAEADLAITVEDDVCGGGWPISITDPDGNVGAFTGLSGDIGLAIDPDTGQAVSGRICHASLRNSTLLATFGRLPKGIESSSSVPWLVEFTDINGSAYTFKVVDQMPDRTLGLTTLMLGFYRAN